MIASKRSVLIGVLRRETGELRRHARSSGARSPGRHGDRSPTPRSSWRARRLADTPANFDIAWDLLLGLGLPLKDKHEAWEQRTILRTSYGNQLQELMDFLVTPRGFWGHSAEEIAVQEVAQSTAQAHPRTRAGRRDR